MAPKESEHDHLQSRGDTEQGHAPPVPEYRTHWGEEGCSPGFGRSPFPSESWGMQGRTRAASVPLTTHTTVPVTLTSAPAAVSEVGGSLGHVQDRSAFSKLQVAIWLVEGPLMFPLKFPRNISSLGLIPTSVRDHRTVLHSCLIFRNTHPRLHAGCSTGLGGGSPTRQQFAR